jgi:predicted tellurium resistance membrane protein TerC
MKKRARILGTIFLVAMGLIFVFSGFFMLNSFPWIIQGSTVGNPLMARICGAAGVFIGLLILTVAMLPARKKALQP